MDFDPLLPYLPEGDFIPLLKKWLEHEKFELILHRPRATKLGDFRPPRKGNIAKITLNSNLGPYQFLTTLTHEIAHLKEKNHSKAFYQLCCYMEPDYHQYELDTRIYLTHLDLLGGVYFEQKFFDQNSK